jgi:hypothetical protein
MTGIKHDKEKARVALVLGGFANALLDVSKVGTFGAKNMLLITGKPYQRVRKDVWMQQ